MYPLLTRSTAHATSRPVQFTQQSRQSARRAPQLFHRQRKASYYFEAGRHTSLSLRLLLSQLREQKVAGHHRRTKDYLCMSMDNLLASIRPGIDDDAQSRQYFIALLRMHLSYLTDDEIKQLHDELKDAQFACNIVKLLLMTRYTAIMVFPTGHRTHSIGR